MPPTREGSPEIPEPPPRKMAKKISTMSAEAQEKMEHIVVMDLSEGKELYPVPVFNSYRDRKIPEGFEYIKTIEMYKNYERNPVVCDCDEGCDEKCPCMEEPFHDRTEPAYENGLLSKRMPEDWPDLCPVIWECSTNCACGPECPTRNAQHGLRWKLEVYMTSKKGWGVRAVHTIPKGAFISEYSGVMKDAKENDMITDNNWYSFEIASQQQDTNFFIDATQKGNVSRFFNHSCNPNMFAVHVFYDDNNPGMGMHICFYAKREIKGEWYATSPENGVETLRKGEEMTFDYGAGYWEGKLSKGMGCECGDKNCQYRLKKGAKRKSAIVSHPEIALEKRGIPPRKTILKILAKA